MAFELELVSANDLTEKTAAELWMRLAAIKKAVKEFEEAAKNELADWMRKNNQDVIIINDMEYLELTNKAKYCHADAAQILAAVLEKKPSQEQLAACLSANAFKAGEVKKLIPEQHITESLYWTEYEETVELCYRNEKHLKRGKK
jgi:hypothetical protein